MSLEAALGIDPADPEYIRAQQLADADRVMLRDLVAVRRRHGLTQERVGELMGISQPSVAAIEGHDANPKLSTIRRYAVAIGALIRHEVVSDPEYNAATRNQLRLTVARPGGGAVPFRESERWTRAAESRRFDFALAA